MDKVYVIDAILLKQKMNRGINKLKKVTENIFRGGGGKSLGPSPLKPTGMDPGVRSVFNRGGSKVAKKRFKRFYNKEQYSLMAHVNKVA